MTNANHTEITRQLGQMLMDDDTFNTHLQAFVSWARKSMHGQKQLPPHLFLLHRTSEGYDMVVLVLNIEIDVETKYQALMTTGMRVARQHPDMQPAAVFMVSEAWVSRQTEMLPADAPDRKEVVLVSGVTIDGRANMATIDIQRGTSGRMADGDLSLMPYSASDADILGQSYPNRLILSFLQGFSLAWLGQHKSKLN